MTMKYFAETDTLKIEFRHVPVVDSREIGKDTVVDMDTDGQVCRLTIARYAERGGAPQFFYEKAS